MMAIVWIFISIAFLSFFAIVLRGAPFVPSQKKYLRELFSELYIPAENDVLADIGSGNGIVLNEALRAGFSKVIGYELNPFLALYSKIRLRKLSKKTQNQVFVRDFLLTELADDITVFYCFGVSNFIPKAMKKVQEYSNLHNKKVYFISLAFENKGFKPSKSNKLYFLYEISPCKNGKA